MKVNVKWNRQTYDMEIEQEGPLDLFKAQLFALTNVPVERQKLLVRGKKLNNDSDLANLKNNQKIMMMGSADALPTAPKEEILFAEDLTDSQKETMTVSTLPVGLRNLGNTCYLNSTIQCLKGVPELKSMSSQFAATSFQNINTAEFGHSVTANLGTLFQQLDKSPQTVVPLSFLASFKSCFPQFAQTGQGGVPMQQDADESLSQLLHAVDNQLKGPEGGSKALFEGEMVSSIKNTESEEEPAEEKKHSFSKLSCHISIKTDHLLDGIKDGLVENIEKHSATLQRNAVYEKTDQISKLPPYLNVQFVRFFWKTDTQKKAKILRKVVFPMKFDVSSFCTAELRAEITSYRNKVEDALEAFDERKRQARIAGTMDIDEVFEVKEEEGICHKKSGLYELFGVITHKGRAADSGHYIGWVKNEAGVWHKYDDDIVTQVKEDEIRALSGGGDWHMSYILFYKAVAWKS